MRKGYIIILSAFLLILLPAIALAANPPTVETYTTTDTNAIYDITNIITLTGNVSDNGTANIETRGFVYDFAQRGEPDSDMDSTDYNYWTFETGNWTGGEYSANITHLESGTRYFFRAGVKNDTTWGFGEEQTFVTTAEAESSANVTADEIADIADTLSTYLNLFVIGLAVCGLVSLAFIRGSMILYVVSGIAVLVFGLYFTDTHLAIGSLIAILGLYCFWKAIEVR